MPKKINNLNQPATQGNLLETESRLDIKINKVEERLEKKMIQLHNETQNSLDQILSITQRLDQDRMVALDRVRRLEQKPSDL